MLGTSVSPAADREGKKVLFNSSIRPRTRAFAALSGVLLLLLAIPALASVVQRGKVRVTLLGQVKPYRLPRAGTAPIAVFISGHIATADHSTPPQLQQLDILINRHGYLQSAKLPTCREYEIEASSTARALATCGDALVGSGRFWASIVISEQRPYRTRGRLLVFNGRRDGHPVLFSHVYTTKPFATSFVVTFAIHHISKGRWGTRLTASLPETLGSWGYLDRIKLTMRRTYTYRGRKLSYFNAACPAPAGFPSAVFPIALAKFAFADGERVHAPIIKNCGVKK